MTKGKIIGYIGIIAIIGVIAFLGSKYYAYTKQSGEDKKTTIEITKYPNLICNKMTSSTNYSKNNIITMAFDKNNLVWLRDLSVYYYFDNNEYIIAKNKLNATESDMYQNTYQDDNLIISTMYEGEINDVLNSDWSLGTDTYTYDDLIKYYQDKEYTCEVNN